MSHPIKLTSDQVSDFANAMGGKALTHIVDQNGLYNINQQTVDRAIEWVMSNYFHRFIDDVHGVSDFNEQNEDLVDYDYTGTQYELRYYLQDILNSHVKNLINMAIGHITEGEAVVEMHVGTNKVRVQNVHDLQRYPRMNPDIQSCITS